MLNTQLKLILALLALACSGSAFAAASPITDDFTGASSANKWVALNYACLTAGDGSGTIPACSTPQLTAGNGALRLTPASGNTTGAILSDFTFPSTQGLQVTFTTYAYGGSKDGPAGEGADGISFFLTDGTQPTPAVTGGLGGSLGYSCSNVNSQYNGLVGAYLGLGMDEYGNFLNGGSSHDNTATGIPIQTTSSSTNGYNGFTSGSYQQANRIGLRGAGNVNWTWLNANYPSYYPSSLSASAQQTAVQNTCKVGQLRNYGGAQPPIGITGLSSSGTTLTVTVPNHGFSNGDTVLLSGTITDDAPIQAITNLSNSGTTLTVTVPNHGFSNGDTVNIGGSITDTAPPQSISSITSSSTSKIVTIVTNSSNGFSSGNNVTFGGTINVGTFGSISGSTYTITRKTSTKFTITLSSKAGGTTSFSSATATDISKPGPAITGQYAISGVTQNTFTVTLSGTPGTITNNTGNVALAVPTIPGSYTVSNVTTNTFDVTLPSTPGTITNTSGTASDSTQSTTGAIINTAVMDYAPIPGGYWVLPASQLIANENATTRTNAWPITYKLMITPAGLLSFWYNYNNTGYTSVIINKPITASNGPLPASFRFGFSGSTGGSTNVHEITCFSAQPTQSAGSIGTNVLQTGQLQLSTQVYLGYYSPNNWWGALTANALVANSDGSISAASAANWDGNCVLTGGGCSSMGTYANGDPIHTITTAQSPLASSSNGRQLLTWDGSGGIPLEWANITTAQQAILNTDNNGQNRLNWLRGDRSQETVTSNPLRSRTGVLGDIIDSSPTWVGAPSQTYASPFGDAVYGSTGAPENATGAQAYSTYAGNMATRTNVVYSGSNDGLLHGFQAGSYNTDGSYNSATNNGLEVIGFMPSSVLANSNVVDLTSPNYNHNYFVDATPGSGDLFYGGTWHTWLVGGLGSGGAEIYALDISDPTKFAETHAASLVKGDWTSSTLTCSNTTGCGANMGNSFGTPLIRRLHNGQWAIIFGNGLDSSTGNAGVFVGLVDSTTGAVTYSWLDTGVSSGNDGIAYVASADLDGDHVTDYLYGGDLLGNVWRFDLTSSNPADWGVSKFGNAGATPLFTAKIGSTPQPITTQVEVASSLTGGANRVMVMFGTGQKIPATSTSPDIYATGTQTFYGIWDWDMSKWNNGTTTTNSVVIPASGVQYAALTGPQSFTRSDLLAQALDSTTAGPGGTSQVLGYRSISAGNSVCWKGGAGCSQYGWDFDLPGTNEQIIYNPVIVGGAVTVNTAIPPSNTAGQCSQTLQTGWTMAFNIASGGGMPENFFPDASGSFAASSTGTTIAGIQLNGVGSVSTVSVGSTTSIVTQTSAGTAATSTYNGQGGITANRVTWQEIR